MTTHRVSTLWLGLLAVTAGCVETDRTLQQPQSLDAQVRQSLQQWGIAPIIRPPAQSPELVALGQTLYVPGLANGDNGTLPSVIIGVVENRPLYAFNMSGASGSIYQLTPSLVASPLWLAHYRFGPLEWCWRSLTYWKRQPMRVAVETVPSQVAEAAAT